MKNILIYILILCSLFTSYMYYNSTKHICKKCMYIQFNWKDTDIITLPPNITIYIPDGTTFSIPKDKTLIIESDLIVDRKDN